jgi:hypothetical protein
VHPLFSGEQARAVVKSLARLVVPRIRAVQAFNHIQDDLGVLAVCINSIFKNGKIKF